MIPFYTYALFIKYFKLMSSFSSKLFSEKKCISNQSFSFKHKVNKSNTKVFAHYLIICLYSENVCFNNFVVNKCFNFFRDMFYSKSIEISSIIIIHMQRNAMSPISEYSSRFIIYALFFIFGKLSREKTPLNGGSFW